MKEGISYSFLLNIIIVFIVVCAAIITGIFSYYRAFRAGTAIVNEIEKFEGYNCVSAESISKKLSGIGYNLPFSIRCKDSEKDCVISADGNYKVLSYNYNDESNLTGTITSYSENIFYRKMNKDYIYSGADYYCGEEEDGQKKCYYTTKYGYGIYTYMYTQLPVVSSFLKIPIYFKTKDMVEQRNLNVATKDGNPIVFDKDVIPRLYYIAEVSPELVFSSEEFPEKILEYYKGRQGNIVSQQENLEDLNKYIGYKLNVYGYGVRRNNSVYDPDEVLSVSSLFKYDLRDLFKWANVTHPLTASSLTNYYKNACGYQVDWSLY